MTEADRQRIAEIRKRLSGADEGPWYPGRLDDELYMNARVVLKKPFPTRTVRYESYDKAVEFETDQGDRWDALADEQLDSILACTMLQAGTHRIGTGTEKWDENMEFIAHARADIPWLLERIECLEANHLKQVRALSRQNQKLERKLSSMGQQLRKKRRK